MHDDLLYQVALTQVNNIGAVQAKILVEHFGTAKEIFSAKKKDLGVIENIGEVRAASIKHFTDFKVAEEEIKFIDKYKITPLFLNDDNYPKRLLHCYDSPTLLYFKGTTNLNAEKIISVIGTRTNTDYGKQLTEQLIEGLKDQNVLVISGLAFGIDAIAHKNALKNNLQTVGVLAHGLDSIYPSQHTGLAKEMIEQGGYLPSLYSGTKPDKHNFPRRNRIVAGMADATIVVETAVKGGSIITAELANNYNKDVFAFPGRVHETKSMGCNYLIKTNKAALLTDAVQLLESMGWQQKMVLPKKQKQLFVDLSPDEKIIVDLLRQNAQTHIDEIFLKCGLTSSAVAASILNLELNNLIVSMPGKLYKLQ